MKKSKKFKILPLLIILFVLLFGIGFIIQSQFKAPRKSGPKVLYSIPKTATVMAITGDLKYYDFIKDENAFKFALWVGGGIQGKDIQRGMVYEISQTMSVW